MSSPKFRPYFKSHPIIVKTNYPINIVFRKLELTSQIAKRSIQLGAYDIQYEPWIFIKSQGLANFVSNFRPGMQAFAYQEVNMQTNYGDSKTWMFYSEGASNVRGIGLRIMLVSLEGDECHKNCTILPGKDVRAFRMKASHYILLHEVLFKLFVLVLYL